MGLKVLKNKLSEYVRLAAGGEVVLITDRDRVVAELVPPRLGRAEWVSDSQLADAVRQGWITLDRRASRVGCPANRARDNDSVDAALVPDVCTQRHILGVSCSIYRA